MVKYLHVEGSLGLVPEPHDELGAVLAPGELHQVAGQPRHGPRQHPHRAHRLCNKGDQIIDIYKLGIMLDQIIRGFSWRMEARKLELYYASPWDKCFDTFNKFQFAC